jgi:hypothetical protein
MKGNEYVSKQTEDQFIHQIVVGHYVGHDTLRRNIQLHGRLIQNVPVYPDYKGRPSEIVSGKTLSRIYSLIEQSPHAATIQYTKSKESSK